MAKVVGIHTAKVLSIEPIGNPPLEDWSWRKLNVGMTGTLNLMESERVVPGLHFIICRNTDGWWMKTTYGREEINGNIMTFTSRHSIYTFELLDMDIIY